MSRYVELHADNVDYPAIIDIVSRNTEKKEKYMCGSAFQENLSDS